MLEMYVSRGVRDPLLLSPCIPKTNLDSVTVLMKNNAN